MSERIHETILITRNGDGTPHIAPMGLRQRGPLLLLAPFKPSRTLDNLLRDQVAVVNTTDDVRVYAGCLTGRHDWPLTACTRIDGLRLADALYHREIRLAEIEEDQQRPRLLCDVVYEKTHRPYRGYNRAQGAVLELAILVSRLGMLPMETIDNEIKYLRIAMDKTAGDEEWEAWQWLMERVAAHRAQACA